MTYLLRYDNDLNIYSYLISNLSINYEKIIQNIFIKYSIFVTNYKVRIYKKIDTSYNKERPDK